VQPVIYQAETDWGRYTSVNTIAPGGMNGYCQGNDAYYTATSSYKTADKLTSGANQMLKAVGIYVPADSMSYKVEVSLKGTTPADTTTIYIKSGTFGQDGTALYKGYRTIDFDKFVYLPNTQNYIITVTLTGTDGTTYVVPLSGAAQKDTYTTVAAGTSFIYDAATGIWVDTKNTTGKDGYTNLAIPMYALGKYSNEANGGDFTVVSLNDNGAGGSEIYLGKKEELYTTDLLHPALMADGVATSVSARHTLSNMTVELTKGLTDSVYGGVISGDGSVTKTGDGILALSGANTYTGDTNVNVGSLALTGSLQSPVIVANGATFTGYGTISGNLTNSGTLQPGLTAEVRNLFTAASGGSSTTTVPQVGTLTVNGNLTSTGKLVIATINKNVSKLEVRGISTLTGTTLSVVNGGTNPLVNLKYNYLTSQGGITGNVTATDVSPYITLSATTDGNNAYFTAIQNQTLGGLANMTTSEISVGSALNKKILEVGQADSDSTTTATLNSLLYQNATASKATMASITAEARAQLLTVSPLTAMTIGAAYDRLDTMDLNGNALVPTTANSFDGVPATMKVDIPMALDADNELWFKLFRGYEMYGGNSNSPDLNNKSFGGAIGYDRAIPGTTTRVGGLFAYGHTDYAAGTLNGDSHDWRIGTYASHDDGTWKTQGLIAYGRNHYDINRTIANYGDRLNANYKANVFDASAKVKYLPQQNRLKSVQVAPYASLSYTHTSQDGYSETGGSAFAQSLDSASNNSLRGEVGLEFTHNINMTSSVGGSIGYKRVLSGVNPELNGTFTGDNNRFHITTDNDRNYITYNLNVRKNTGNNWTIQGELRGEKSAHNHSEVYSALAKYAF
jgi:autotransporter-associated beta strand protein